MVNRDPILQRAHDIAGFHGSVDCDGRLSADAPYCSTVKNPVLCPACQALANAIEAGMRDADRWAREDERQDMARLWEVFERARARYKARRTAKLLAERQRR